MSMTTYGAPGVYSSVTLNGPTPSPTTVSPSVAGFTGEHWRGPVGTAVQCNSWSDFVRYFGGFNLSATPALANPYLAYEVYEYFANGGKTAWIQRIGCALSQGSAASVTLKDQAATPQNTITLTAGMFGIQSNVGTWGNNIYCSVTANPSGVGRFNLNVYYGGVSVGQLVESWNSLSMTPSDSRYFVSILNSPSQGSAWVVATQLSDASPAPTNAPAAISSAQFSGGIDAGDPSANDRIAAVTSGTSAFDKVQGVLNYNMPGEVNPAVLSAAILYSQVRPFTFLVMDTPSGQTPAGAVSFLDSLSPVSPNAALYYPWLVATNPSNPNIQSTILLPPGGFILGQMVSNDQARGVWFAAAGITTVLSNIVQAERLFTPSDLGTLNTNNVNALLTQPNGQVVIWGTRTMESGYANLFIPVQRTLNYIQASLTQQLQFAIFQPNDLVLWTNIAAVCTAFLDGLLAAGAFPSNQAASAFYVICDSTNNTPTSIGQGVVNVTIGVALVVPAEFIQLNIVQFQSSGATTVTVAP